MTGGDASVPEDAWLRGLWPMVLVQAALSASFTLFVPLLPLYLPELGVRSPDAVALWAGWLNGATPLVAVFTAPLWGRVADRWGRRRVIVISALGIAASTAFGGLGSSPWLLLALRASMGVFSGFAPAGIALVAARAPASRMGFALGWLASGQVVGQLVGPLVGGLIATVAGVRPSFWVTGLMLTGVALLAHLTLRDVTASPRSSAGPAPRLRDSLKALWRQPVLVALIGLMLAVQISLRGVQPILSLVVQQLCAPGAPVALLAGLAFSMVGFGDVVAAPFLGRRSDVLGYRRVLLLSLVGVALFTGLQGVAGRYWILLAGRFAAGMFVGGILATINALIGRATPDRERGLVYGLTSSAGFMGGFLGPIAGGFLSANLGLRAPFIGSAALLLTGAGVAAAVLRTGASRAPKTVH